MTFVRTSTVSTPRHVVPAARLCPPHAHPARPQCVENQQPSLRGLPLGIRQKGILATCNYAARRRGVGKLMPVAEAKKICPDLVIADGEDLSPFRDVSKRLYALLRSYSWNAKAERLGLDEIFLDVTDIVSYNVELLNRNALRQSYFCLSRSDPDLGFDYDATSFAGCVHGPGEEHPSDDNVLRMRLLVASHLARYLRLKVEQEGYTSTCGIATNKLLAKLAGDKNKPQNQTTLLALRHEDVLAFMDAHNLRKVPGIGSKTARVLERFVLGREPDHDVYSMECSVTAGQVRTHPSMSAPALERLFSGPGSERGLGHKIWALLYGVDDSEVKPARDIPTQISIEDSYRGLNEPREIERALLAISASLLRRMQVDLLEDDNDEEEHGAQPLSSTHRPRKWLAYPRTIRLSTRPYTRPADNKPYNWARASRSSPLPSFVFAAGAGMPTEQVAARLVAETLLPLFRRLHPESRGWNVGLLNVCVTNMAGAAAGGGGGDIAAMFRRQGEALRGSPACSDSGGDRSGAGEDDEGERDRLSRQGQQRASDGGGGAQVCWAPPEQGQGTKGEEEQVEEEEDDTDMWDEDLPEADSSPCPVCGRLIPHFAVVAHERYHNTTDDR